MKLKKILLATVAIMAGVSLAACSGSSSKKASTSNLEKIKEKGTLVVATSPDYAPFEFQTLVDGKNKVVGADILLAEKLAKELGVKLEISSMNFDNVLNAVQSGKADIAIAGLSYTTERAKVFDFTEKYYQVTDMLLVKKSDVDKYKDVDALKGKKLAVQKGTTQETYAKENLKDAHVVSLTIVGEAINELNNGQVDAIMLDSSVAEGYASQNSDLAIAAAKFPEHESNAKVIALPKGSDDLKKAFDKVIKEVADSGEYNKYLQEVSKYTVSEEK